MLISVFVFTLTFAAQASLAQTVSQTAKMNQLQQRLRTLEKQQKEMQKWYANFYLLGKNRIKPFFNEKISLGGYFESRVAHISGTDMETQTSANNNTFGLNLSIEFDETARFVAQTLTVAGVPLVNFHNNPNLTPSKRQFSGFVFGQILAQGYLEYSAKDSFNIQSGLGYVPFGIAYQQREPVLFLKRGGPQMIVNDDGTGSSLASPLWMGLHIHGLLPFEKMKAGYNLYTVPPTTNVAMIGVGGRFWWSISESLKTGLSFQYGERIYGSYLSRGFDFDIRQKNFGLLGEYAVRVSTAFDADSESYYLEPHYRFLDNKWLVFLDVQYLKLPLRIDAATQIADPIEKRFYGGGVNWLPLSTIRVRLNYLKHDYINETDSIQGQKRDYDVVESSVAIAF